MPEVEIVYELLKASKNESRKLRDLLQQAFIIKGLPLDDHQRMAAVHTEIILDHRFISMGQGNWGLKEGTKKKLSDVLSPVPVHMPIRFVAVPYWKKSKMKKKQLGEK